MKPDVILLMIAAAIFFGYTYGHVYRTVGMLKSISDSVYHVKHKILFQLTMMIFPIFFMIPALNVASTWVQQFAGFWAGALIVLVGVAACFKKGGKTEEKLHVIGATGGIFLGTIYVSTFGWIFTVIAILFALFVLYATMLPKIQDKIFAKYVGEGPDYTETKLESFVLALPRVHNFTWVIEVVAVCMILLTVLFQVLIS